MKYYVTDGHPTWDNADTYLFDSEDDNTAREEAKKILSEYNLASDIEDYSLWFYRESDSCYGEIGL